MLVVIVNGLPGSGKTTLARRLSVALTLPLFSKDVIKESVGDVLAAELTGACDPSVWQRVLGIAAGETLWALLADSPGGGIVESPLLGNHRAVAEAGLRRAGVDHAHEVWCEVPLEVSRTRFAARARRHVVHREPTDDEWRMWAKEAYPLRVGQVHRVDTTNPVDVARLAEDIRQAHASCAG